MVYIGNLSDMEGVWRGSGYGWEVKFEWIEELYIRRELALKEKDWYTYTEGY